MSKNFVQNALLRKSLLTAYRGYARAQIWRSGPRIFVNSIPKAGTHLLTAELEKFPQLQNSRLHIQAHKVNAATASADFKSLLFMSNFSFKLRQLPVTAVMAKLPVRHRTACRASAVM